MAVVTSTQVNTLEFLFNGTPALGISSNGVVTTLTLEYMLNGSPFLAAPNITYDTVTDEEDASIDDSSANTGASVNWEDDLTVSDSIAGIGVEVPFEDDVSILDSMGINAGISSEDDLASSDAATINAEISIEEDAPIDDSSISTGGSVSDEEDATIDDTDSVIETLALTHEDDFSSEDSTTLNVGVSDTDDSSVGDSETITEALLPTQIKLYSASPFIASNVVNPMDFLVNSLSGSYPEGEQFVEGFINTLPMINKTSESQVAQTLMINDTVYFEAGGAFTPSNTEITLNTTTFIPGQQAIIPGSNPLVFSVYDQAIYSEANVAQVPCYLIDATTTWLYKYVAVPNTSGLIIQPMNYLNSSFLASTNWFLFAYANADGTAGSFTNSTLSLPPISATSILANPCSIGNTSITLTDSSQFLPGDYIQFIDGIELVHVSSIVGNVLTVDPLQYNHSIGETINVCGKKFWVQVTVPIDFTGGTPFNYPNVGLQITVGIETR